MSAKKYKALILHFYDLYNHGNLDEMYGENVAPEFVLHTSFGDQSRDQVKQFDILGLRAFPDSYCIVSNMVAEGDKVAFQVSWKATHKGEYMGVTPTGKKLQMLNTHIVRIKANKIAEWWGTSEIAIVFQQIGVKPQ